jgi:LuxR family maltose regulon positive regulatory protein
MLNIPVSKTKIIPPRRRDELLERKRLLDMLFEALDKKLTLVSAPAGYGKTSLLIDLVKQSEYKSCWLSLDELDREPQRFVAYLLASIAQQFPGFGQQTAAVLNGLTSIQNEMERLAVMMVNEAYELINEHFVLILDDFHILENDTPIHDFLNRFIQLVDDNCHIVISSRTLTTLYDLPLMVAREQVSGLSFSDLTFRKEEIQALILQNNHVHISDEDAQKLIDETEGWITGLQFSGINLARKSITKPIANTGVGLFDYLGQQVVDRQPLWMREFLMRTSIMEEFDSELCEAVLAPLYPEKQDWDTLIKAVIQNNLFALPVGADGRSLRYHHLFRDYLQARFKREHQQEIHLILARLGNAYETMGEWEKAHYVIKQLGDMEALARVIERASFNNLQKMSSLVEGWLYDLPPSILRNHAGILSVSGTIELIKGDFRNGIAHLDRSIEAFLSDGNIAQLALALIRRSTGHRYLGDYPAALLDVEEALRLTEDRDDMQSLFAEALHIKGMAFFRMGNTRQALDLYRHSHEILIRLNEVHSIPELLLEIGTACLILGDFREAEKSYNDLLKIWKREGNIWSQAILLNNIGNMYHQEGYYEKSAHAYEDGLLCAQRSGHTRSEALISISLGDLYTELMDFEIAAQSYLHAEKLLQDRRDQFLVFSLHVGRINLAILKNELDDAHSMIADLGEIVKPDQSHYENGTLDFVSGKLHLLSARFPDAIRCLQSAELHFEEDGRELEMNIARVWLAAAYLADEKREAALQKIEEVFANRRIIAHFIIVAVAQSKRWLASLQKDPNMGRLIRDLFLRAERLMQKFPAIRRELHLHVHAVQVPDARLSIQAFGHPVVRVAGRTLNISDWQTQSVRDLFFLFLTQSRFLSKEQIAQVIWPEWDEPSKIKLRFKNELYRLRRAVGQETILFENNLYSFNRSLDYEYDVESFESHIARAKSAQTIEEQINSYRKAVDLVQGPYLIDLYFDWILIDRERLNQIYLKALLTLAELYQKQALLGEALAMCQRALEADPVLEPAFRIMLQIHHRLGDRQAMARTYQTCSQALHQYLSMPPSQQTEELYRKLTA